MSSSPLSVPRLTYWTSLTDRRTPVPRAASLQAGHPTYVYLVPADVCDSALTFLKNLFLRDPQLCRALEMGPRPALDAKKILAQGENCPYLTFHAHCSEARPLQEVLGLPGWRREAGMGWTPKITACAQCTLLLEPVAFLV